MTVGYFMNYLAPFYPNWSRERARELLRQFGLPLDCKLKNLSRGMRMKAMLASSLAYSPRLLILDEPFSGLDPLVRDELTEGLLENMEGTSVLVASHDLAEMESIASHIGYLEAGKLRFSEEMGSLAERFREVEIRRDTANPPPGRWPEHWINLESSGAVTRFVDVRYERDRCAAEVRNVFGGVEQLDARPMPLRAIFVSLAKAGKGAV